jgi:hypothetical protein
MPPEHPGVGGEPGEAEEVLSYWFPEDLADADMETLRRHGQRWMAGGLKVDREITERFGDVLERARRGELDPLGRDAARTPGAHHSPGPVLPKHPSRLATILLAG